uniref:C-type lectin domain-containing protein n=1 Tax=Branchiostoma floridae TaxID=7739 RepID=C3YJF1_BRAFL|eukprot:XP_002603539.1 hypothetical protein BRAFLDRAFT_79074 [Branchiostoma floridae]
MQGDQQQSQTGDTGTTPMQQPQTDWRSIADAAASIPNALYVPRADRTYPGGTSGHRALCSFIRSHHSCIIAGFAVLLSLVAVGLAPLTFINIEEISQLSTTVNDLNRVRDDMRRDLDKERNRTAAMEQRLNEMSKTPAPLCQGGWSNYNNHCYKLFKDKVSWSTANERCKELGANLASVTSADENNFITRFIANAPRGTWIPGVWFGLNRLDGKWKWADGSALSYTNWAKGEPGNNMPWTTVHCGNVYSKSDDALAS